jgi:hypothetical protein
LRTVCDANVQLPFLAEFPARDREVAEKAVERAADALRQAASARAGQAEKVLAVSRRRVRTLHGAAGGAAFAGGLARERRAFREMWEPPQGLRRSYAKEREAGRRRIAALARRQHVSAAKVGLLIRQSDEELRGALSVLPGKVTPGFNLARNGEAWVNLSPLHKFPLPWDLGWLDPDTDNPHRWFLFRPPFFGFLFGGSFQSSSNFDVDRQHILVPSAGQVGNVATMDCADAGSFDVASVTSESQVAFGFVPPVAGVLEVLVDAQSTIDRHSVAMEDEFGFSNAWCGQSTFLMMNVLHPNVPESSRAQLAGLFEETDGDDLSASREFLTRGAHYYARLLSAGPVPAGRSVVVTVGAQTFDIARANDMTLHSRSDCQWFINSVEVRIAP